MSCFIMKGKTLAIIAGYLADAANEVGRPGVYEGIKTIEPPKTLRERLIEEGCCEDGEFKAEKIYGLLYRYNNAAYKENYGECADAVEPYVRAGIDEKESTRKAWMSNLYTVCRCYRYQIAEGAVRRSPFYAAFSEWVTTMAYRLAEMVVSEVRPSPTDMNYRPWDMF